MIARIDGVDNAPALLASLVSGCAAIVTRAWSVEYVGAPLPDLLAAFAGAGLILSFLPPRLNAEGQAVGRLRMAGTVLFCTLASAYGSGRATAWLASWWPAFDGATILVAFLLAALLQVLIPLVVADPKGAYRWLADLLPRGRT